MWLLSHDAQVQPAMKVDGEGPARSRRPHVGDGCRLKPHDTAGEIHQKPAHVEAPAKLEARRVEVEDPTRKRGRDECLPVPAAVAISAT